MTMLYLSVALGIINCIIMSYVTLYWYRAWVRNGLYSGHALTIGSLFIALISMISALGAAAEIISGTEHIAPIFVSRSFLTFFYAVIQIMFTKGYFNKEKDNG